MSVIVCALCDKFIDSDYIEVFERGSDLVCIDCIDEHPARPISHNTMLKFYRTFQPENTARASAKYYMMIQHKFFRGSHERNSKS